MTFTEAAAEVLRMAGKPLHYKEITELAIEKNLLSHVGKSPEVTMGARLAALLKKEDKENPIVRVKPGVFGLRDWSGKARKSTKDVNDAEDEGNDVNALEVEAHATKRKAARQDDEKVEVSGEDQLRANLAASAAEMFDDEDDDNEPILGSSDDDDEAAPAAAGGAAAGDAVDGSGRRRRRRRRRGRGGRAEEGTEPLTERGSVARLETNGVTEGEGVAATTGDGPAPVVQAREGRSDNNRGEGRGDRGGDRHGRHDRGDRSNDRGSDRNGNDRGGDRNNDRHASPPAHVELPPSDGDEISGKELADVAMMVLSGYDRSQGAVQLKNVADTLIRRERLSGDPVLATSIVSASLRADNARRTANGQRPRFRFGAQGRVALTEWMLSHELARLEQDALSAVERYREAARKTIHRKVQELPGHAFIELALLLLERMNLTHIRSVRRTGGPGGEGHFSAVHKTGTEEIKTALVIRKDGREIGRERVSDLRGAFHHYGPAFSGWLITAGQVLSGAREEANVAAAPPITLIDGATFCRLLEEYQVGVTPTHVTTCIPDVEFFDLLRGS